ANFGLHTPEQLRELIQVSLEHRIRHEQRQAARLQVLQHIAATATWELPQELLMRHARRALARKVMEMRADGIPEQEIEALRRRPEHVIMRSTELALKVHFVL